MGQLHICRRHFTARIGKGGIDSERERERVIKNILTLLPSFFDAIFSSSRQNPFRSRVAMRDGAKRLSLGGNGGGGGEDASAVGRVAFASVVVLDVAGGADDADGQTRRNRRRRKLE